MTESDVAFNELRAMLGVCTDSKILTILHAVSDILTTCDDDRRCEQGKLVVSLADICDLSDTQLLDFFGTTMEAVITEVGEDTLKEFGLYRILCTSPDLSPVCKAFFDAWAVTYFRDNPVRCQFRRIGEDAYRLVAVLPGVKTVEYPETITAAEAMEHSNCPLGDLQALPILN